MPDHEGIDDVGRHPAQLAERQRYAEPQRIADLRGKIECLPHCRGTAVAVVA